jgi:hypothetical protein
MKKINIPQKILDLSLSAFFVLLSMFILKFILPFGYTTRFLNQGYKLVFIIFILLFVLFVISIFFYKQFEFKRKIDFPELKDLTLLCLPMSPILGFTILNIEYLNLFGFINLIGVTLVFCLIICFIIPIILSYFGSLKILMISGLALCFTILNMAQITNNPTSHIFNSQFITQGLYLIGSFIVTYLLYTFNKTIAYTLIIVFMVSGVFISFINTSYLKSSEAVKNEDRFKSLIENSKNKIIHKKNIYVLVFESYSNLETLEFYGYDNTNQINYLKNNNFTIYHGSYSNGAKSLSSTARILELKNNLDKDERYYLNGNAFVLNIFKANGYKTVGLFKSPYSFGSSPISWDEYYPKDDVSKIGGKTILKAIYEGYFRFDIFDDNYDYSKYLDLRDNYLKSNQKKPLLFYTHNNYPGHSQNSGKCLSDEKKKHFEGIEIANLEMKKDIQTIKKYNPNSIIVIVGDHGPYLTKNCTALIINYKKEEVDRYDVQDRYGAFLAIHWPETLETKKHNIEIIQDIFPAILANITKNNKLFDKLKLQRKFLDKYHENTSGVNVNNGILEGGKDDKKSLFQNKSIN